MSRLGVYSRVLILDAEKATLFDSLGIFRGAGFC